MTDPTPCPACGDPVEGAEYCELHDPGLRVAPLGDWSWGVIIAVWVVTLVGLAAANTWMGNWPA